MPGSSSNILRPKLSPFIDDLTGKTLKTTLAPEPRTADFQIWISDFRKATDVLGWQPRIDLRSGYQSIVDWVRREEAALRALYL